MIAGEQEGRRAFLSDVIIGETGGEARTGTRSLWEQQRFHLGGAEVQWCVGAMRPKRLGAPLVEARAVS